MPISRNLEGRRKNLRLDKEGLRWSGNPQKFSLRGPQTRLEDGEGRKEE